MHIQFNAYSIQWIFNSMHIQFNGYSIQCTFNSMRIQWFIQYSMLSWERGEQDWERGE